LGIAMTTRRLRQLIGALAAASVLAGCAESTSSAAPSPFTQDDQCRRSGGFWTGSRCAAMGGY